MAPCLSPFRSWYNTIPAVTAPCVPNILEFGEIPKFSGLAEQAGESNNKYTVNGIFM